MVPPLEKKLKWILLVYCLWKLAILSIVYRHTHYYTNMRFQLSDGSERKVLWEELGAMRSFCEGPWVVCGDFNTTRFPSEKINCSRISGAMFDFSSCINKLELVDPPLFGGSYTWRGGANKKKASRIYRFCTLFRRTRYSLKLDKVLYLACSLIIIPYY